MQVHNVVHMVPIDQPNSALEMARRFTQGKLREAVPEEEQLTITFYATM
uniref:Uncharacterized protein n=1 Tax=Aegilops tauschii subsp. strangulata TaxID=200361 RepID=A0A453MUM3_AEGTS